MSIPLISVIIPAYNASKTIEKAICSVMEQTWKNLEIIIIDDASNDNTAMLVQKLGAANTKIVFFSNVKNKGVSAARNTGIMNCSGEYIAFLDADDFWKRDKLEKQMKIAKKTNCDICFTSVAFADIDGFLTGKIYSSPISTNYKELLKENCICCSSSLIKKSTIGNLLFCEEFSHEDFVFFLSLFKNGATAVGIDELLTNYRVGGRSSNKFLAAKNRWKVYRKSEGMSILKSIYYMTHYALNGIKKHTS